jgi:hypothetical protein
MSIKHQRNVERFRKRSKQGFRGYPAATIAYYGPTDRHASKVVVGIFATEEAEAELHKWIRSDTDVRRDPQVIAEIIALTESSAVKSIVVTDRIIGCPHEEGIDYPDGQSCPVCPFWERRDRFTGQVEP